MRSPIPKWKSQNKGVYTSRFVRPKILITVVHLCQFECGFQSTGTDGERSDFSASRKWGCKHQKPPGRGDQNSPPRECLSWTKKQIRAKHQQKVTVTGMGNHFPFCYAGDQSFKFVNVGYTAIHYFQHSCQPWRVDYKLNLKNRHSGKKNQS